MTIEKKKKQNKKMKFKILYNITDKFPDFFQTEEENFSKSRHFQTFLELVENVNIYPDFSRPYEPCTLETRKKHGFCMPFIQTFACCFPLHVTFECLNSHIQ